MSEITEKLLLAGVFYALGALTWVGVIKTQNPRKNIEPIFGIKK